MLADSKQIILNTVSDLVKNLYKFVESSKIVPKFLDELDIIINNFVEEIISKF